MEKIKGYGAGPGGFYRKYGKRMLDILLSLLALIILLPLFVILAIAVRLDSPGPALYWQERLGLRGKIFRAAKFRTMTDIPRRSEREILPNDPEVTQVGGFLRRYKLDELIQLIHVLHGEMSIIGPRPALPEQLAEYDEYGLRRLLVKPGLSGLAQVNGNIYLTWPQRWKFDARYVDECSFRLDLWIIWRTIAVMILGEKKFLRFPDTQKD
jgi:undecaprenyl phosphate N,N'-diacetylbacillosamine 1-phosphate transferase